MGDVNRLAEKLLFFIENEDMRCMMGRESVQDQIDSMQRLFLKSGEYSILMF